MTNYMQPYIVALFGHRDFAATREIEQRLYDLVADLLRSKPYVEFLVGRDGAFDLFAASVVKRCRQSVRDDNSALIWVLPYLTADFRENQAAYQNYYDEIILSPAVQGKHFKAAISARNREMIDRADLVILCVQKNCGGAYQALRYARQQGKDIVNVAE